MNENELMEHIESLIITLLEEVRVDSDVTTDGRTITIKIAPDRPVENSEAEHGELPPACAGGFPLCPFNPAGIKNEFRREWLSIIGLMLVIFGGWATYGSIIHQSVGGALLTLFGVIIGAIFLYKSQRHIYYGESKGVVEKGMG